MMTWALIAAAGAVGAAARFVVDHLVTSSARRLDGVAGRVPWGTIVVNVSGAFAAGMVAAAATGSLLSAEVATIVAGGFLGAYTTFSTAMYETLRLADEQGAGTALLELSAHSAAALLAAAAGWLLIA
jgi:CrcB protein